MKIAFYSPLKSPNHAVPSGDRLMARLLLQVLRDGGHHVDVTSELRSFTANPDETDISQLDNAAEQEVRKIADLWMQQGKPDLWFCYHPYYKAPDLLGPRLCKQFAIPYATAEASYSRRRNQGIWARFQEQLLESIRQAAVNICFTDRDRKGLAEAAPGANLVKLAPFINPSRFLQRTSTPIPGHLITVAMMRAGDKLSSYAALTRALARLPHLPWTLSIVGDGPCREQVASLFSGFPANRLEWHGEKTPDEIAVLLSQSALYVWPGHGEAYGLAYLEAQAAGVPVIAENIAGVPEVVTDGQTGLLTPAGDDAAYAAAIEHMLTSEEKRAAMAQNARSFVAKERSHTRAAERLAEILQTYVKGPA